jgi:dipeptidyl aminopeptidase/acylaminoacyl peptidase
VTERELREAMRSVPVDDARARTLAVVRAAYVEREPGPARRRWAPALAVAACLLAAIVVAASAGTPGDAVARWVREVLGTGEPHARPALVHVPGGGRLLVRSAGGTWVVSADGSRRRLGAYAGASWSPRGLYVVAWRGGELTALEPSGPVHWSLARPGRIRVARWAPGDGYRIAYLLGGALRIVNGDGTGDRRYAAARPVAPAWQPGAEHVLAFVDRARRIRVVAVDSGRELWRSRPRSRVFALAWSPDGRRLVAASPRRLLLVRWRGRQLAVRRVPGGRVADDVAWSPRGRLTVVRRDARGSEVVVGGRVLFSGPGRFGRVAWSPTGRRLLVPWPDADQWVFLGGAHAAAVGNIAHQFGARAFPDTVEWSVSHGR